MKSEMLLKRFHERLSPMLQGGLMLGAALLCLALAGCKNPSAGGVEQTPQYTVTFSGNGGVFETPEAPKAADSQTRETDSDTALSELMPPPPTRTGYIFSGWYTEPESGGEQFTQETPVTADITVYAKWILQSLSRTITFDGNGGGTGLQTRNVEKGGAIGAENMPPEPAKTGHTFAGWWTEKDGGGEQFTQETLVSRHITVYAKWTPIPYKVNFDVNGGDGPNPEPLALNYGSEAGENMPANPVKGGYVFAGWFTETSGGTIFTAHTLVSGDIAVYAKWILGSDFRTASFNAGGGKPDAQDRFLEPGGAVGAGNMPVDPAKTGHTFDGWWTEQNGGGEQFTQETPVTEDITLYAKWTPNRYTAAFNVNGGKESYPPVELDYGAALLENMPAPPTRTGCTFAGWYMTEYGGGEQFTQETPVTADITVYAKWTVNKYTVTFNEDGGTFKDTEDSRPRVVSYISSVGEKMPADPAKTGHNFDGWWTEQNGGGERFTASTPVTGDITAYAKWTRISYTVNFKAGGGESETQTLTALYEESLGQKMPTVEKPGHTFEGWYTEPDGGGDLFTASTPVIANIAVHAKWTIMIYTVKFFAPGAGGDGSNPYAELTLNYGSAAGENMPETNPERQGFAFDGWYTLEDGGGLWFTASTPVTGNTVVYSKWNSVIDFSVTDPQGSESAGWTYASNTYTIKNGAKVTVKGKTTERRIVVASGATAVITLDGADMEMQGGSAFQYTPPLIVDGGANVTLKLAGVNRLFGSGSGNNSGLRSDENSVLTITSAAGDGSLDGSLTAQGCGFGSAIGGNQSRSPGKITINGGTITANGTHDGAGIGGGQGGAGGIITINGGKVTATSGNDCAAIGGGRSGYGGEITITGGIVSARGRTGIGASISGSGGTITITGGTVTAQGATNGSGAGLGWESGNGGTITITGGTVIAEGRGKDIGGNVNPGTITITGGSVKASKVLAGQSVKDGGGASVYLNTLTVGSAPLSNTAITAATIDGATNYGVKDVKTGADGKVYFWLTENAEGSVELTAGGADYSKSYPRMSAGNTVTLQ
ncbi:MAG: InlB B-repeat-containing protein [Treponema sp.]|jgi:uncharacterized repeat protein (TIGR02543 family)|nr:InlB B-repeat-containing protein [Treponema sp.]